MGTNYTDCYVEMDIQKDSQPYALTAIQQKLKVVNAHMKNDKKKNTVKSPIFLGTNCQFY